MEFKPHKYQEIAIKFLLDNPQAGLFLDMGLGKTAITLSAIAELMYNRFEITKVLVIAPLRVAEDTWSRESLKWDNLHGLRVSKVLGDVRRRRAALAADADIYIINRENVVWLCRELSGAGQWDFDMVVIDELSSFKSPSARRFRALKPYIRRSARIVGLTGTPAPNGYMDLWSQIYLLDGGERLGKTITGYRECFFAPDKRGRNVVYSYRPRAGAKDTIDGLLSDLCLSMSAADWLEMPERIDNERRVRLSDTAQKLYTEFERERYLELSRGEITAATAAALTGKLLQFANGAVYYPDGTYQEVSTAKLDELEDILEAAQGQPVLCFYSFRHDLYRISERFPDAVQLKTSDDIEAWNNGEIRLLLAHPAGAGHGLNLQAGGHIIVWYGLTYSLELYQQANARLYRQGQENSVIIHHIITEGTADTTVLAALQGKADVQEALLDSLKARYNTETEV